MDKKTKLILSGVGIAAVVVPALLLVIFSSRVNKNSNIDIPSGSREIDKSKVEETVKKLPKKELEFPSPLPSTPSAFPSPAQNGSGVPFSGSPSAR